MGFRVKVLKGRHMRNHVIWGLGSKLLKGGMYRVPVIGLIKGDTRSIDHGSYELRTTVRLGGTYRGEKEDLLRNAPEV